MIVVGAYRGLGPAVVGTNRGLADPAGMGICCCNPTEYKSVQIGFNHAQGDPSTNPITSGWLTLFFYEQNSTHADDIIFDLDVSPMEGLLVSHMYNQDWTLKLLIDGEEAGLVVYHFVSGSGAATFYVNLTVYYGGYMYRAEGVNVQEMPMYGLFSIRHACTRTPIPAP